MDKKNFSQHMQSLVEQQDWPEIERYFNEGPFTTHMGLRVSLEDIKKPRVDLVEPQPFHLGGVGQDYVNGAITAGMFDFVIGLIAIPFISQGHFATTNVNIQLVKPLKQGGVHAVAECTQQIGNRLFVDAVIFDGESDPCCHATGEIRVGIRSHD